MLLTIGVHLPSSHKGVWLPSVGYTMISMIIAITQT
jgi:hypothetical protein